MKVLVAVNDADFAKAIIEFISNYQWPPQTQFTILGVIEPLKIGNAMAVLPGPVLDELEAAHSTHARQIVSDAAFGVRMSVRKAEVQEDVIEGFPKDEILRRAKELNADMIIVGSHNKRLLEKVFLGSVSLAVVSHAKCTVLVVHLPATPAKSNVEEMSTPLTTQN